MFYTSQMEVYVGQQPNGPYKIDTNAKAVVQRLCQPILKTNRNVTTDNWFYSIPLADSLRDNGLTFIGTMRKNKREIPDLFTQKNERPIGSSMFAFGCGGTLVSYIPKKNKNVLLFSMMRRDNINGVTGKPEIIHRYNETKGGVDVVDKLCAQYNVARGTRRWPKHGNVAGINSFIIYNSKKSQLNIPKKRIFN
ncbi:hypothetical protein NQ318_009599 [Aromia moschata]|uniref:PiggyBac transposable element-derived protein domain-containing protein n=1 Tax=Aromia moschata TaxID=1265417 RepID=A0AAV8X993_9CUCU|nr:hypothetical protein NQ318_009599 [Aromia moschata]